MDWRVELKEYIAHCLKLGFSESEIRLALRSVGWKDADMEEGFGSVVGAVIPSPAKRGEKSHRSFDRLRRSQDDNYFHMLSADKTPNLLLPLPANEQFPPAVKTAIPLLLALLARRIETLKRVARTARRKSAPVGLLSGFRRQPLAIAAAAPANVLLLAAPSRSLIWMTRLQFIAERVFSRIEFMTAIIGKIVLLPVAFFGLALRPVNYLGAGLLSRLRSPAPKSQAVLGRMPASPATMLIGEKFPEHIVISDIFKLAGRMFRTRRLRTFLTISGISVGIGTILFLVSFGYGLQNILFERITTEEALLTLDVIPPTDSGVVAINDTAVEKVRGMSEVAEISKMAALNGEMVFGESSAAGFVYAVDESYLRIIGLRPAAGQIINEENHSGAVISTAAMKLLGWGDAPELALGRELSFVVALPKENGEVGTVALDKKLKVIGVADDPMLVFAYLPIGETGGLKLPPYSQLKVKVKDMSLLDPARDQILKMGFLVSVLSETVDQAKKVFNVVKIVLGLFGVITLIVSAIGMLNTLTIALLERTQEVGIMKAVGASNFDIWKLFLAEAVIMGFVGGIGGILVGFTSATIFNYGINLLAKAFGGQAFNLFQTPMWFVVTIVAFSSCIGIVTGLWPARRAAGLDPLDALKYK